MYVTVMVCCVMLILYFATFSFVSLLYLLIDTPHMESTPHCITHHRSIHQSRRHGQHSNPQCLTPHQGTQESPVKPTPENGKPRVHWYLSAHSTRKEQSTPGQVGGGGREGEGRAGV